MAKRFDIKLSIDSTKWSRACTQELKDKYDGQIMCRRETRQEFFEAYKKKIRSMGVALQNDYVDGDI